VERARHWLDDGAPLVGTLRGRARFAVAGYLGGGRANADAVEAAGFDVLRGAPKASGARRAAATLRAFRMGR
jgi:phytoene/squalene synthetase